MSRQHHKTNIGFVSCTGVWILHVKTTAFYIEISQPDEISKKTLTHSPILKKAGYLACVFKIITVNWEAKKKKRKKCAAVKLTRLKG